ncbi:hypothetical protein C449_05582 [Halococcus saccharolyticus DSM 5350]|uniref:Uncharacterized protein n=1 Tax=Halococcus saccharolyticus DSM 5350 TaxID=1227455 RepID=M0MKH0_9EURY|nr:hypothetical protein C449_05582 [Halococcus saccharolyticus DSM 5350]
MKQRHAGDRIDLGVEIDRRCCGQRQRFEPRPVLNVERVVEFDAPVGTDRGRELRERPGWFGLELDREDGRPLLPVASTIRT